MPRFPLICIASADGSALELLIWAAAGVIWFISQLAAAKKRKEKKRDLFSGAGSPPAGDGDSPDAEDIAAIFKRLGNNIPATPPPAPRPVQRKAAPLKTLPRQPTASSRPVDYTKVRPVRPAPVRTDIAQRLARMKREAAEAARAAELAGMPTPQADAVVETSRAGDVRSLDSAIRQARTILPRLYAMDLQLVPLPSLPMPSVNRTHHTTTPFPSGLHGRSRLRRAIVAQTFLQPGKAHSR